MIVNVTEILIVIRLAERFAPLRFAEVCVCVCYLTLRDGRCRAMRNSILAIWREHGPDADERAVWRERDIRESEFCKSKFSIA